MGRKGLVSDPVVQVPLLLYETVDLEPRDHGVLVEIDASDYQVVL